MAKFKQDDTLVPKVIKEVARELNLPPEMVENAITHFFKWQRESWNELEYSKYLWNYFGTFTMIPGRYEKWINSDKYKKEQQTKLENQNKDNNGKKK